jgi:methyltransferase
MAQTSPLVSILALIIASRLIEMAISACNTRRLRAGGWREVGARHYPLFVLLHVSLLTTIAITTPLDRQPVWPLIGVLGLLQFLRVWTIGSLGRGWTTRIMTLDGAPLTVAGPYRFVRHPAYAIVTIEVAVLPLAFGDWLVALVWSGLNLLLLRHRIAVENLAIMARSPAR